VARDAWGDLYAAGRVHDGVRQDEIALFKLNNGDGVIEWQVQDGGAARLDDAALDVTVGPDGHPVVVGIVRNVDSSAALMTIKYDRITGGVLWADTAPGIVNDQTGDGWVATDAAGDVFTCCKVWGGATSYDLRVRKLDGTDGGELWSVDWTNGTGADDPSDFLLDDGDPVVVGVTLGDFLTVRLDGLDGGTRWWNTYEGPQGWYDVANCAVLADGRVLVTGFSDGTGTSWDVATVAYDAATGVQDWVLRFDGPAGLTDEPADLVAAEGRLVIAGYSYSDVSGQDLLVLDYDLNPATGVGDATAAPLRLAAFPNPFNPRTVIAFDLPESGPVRLTIHDLSGRLVGELLDEVAGAGRIQVPWHGLDADGRPVASGVYVARLWTAAEARSARLVLVR
jgi:hypothetical protein